MFAVIQTREIAHGKYLFKYTQVQTCSLKLVYYDNQGMSLECFYSAFQFGRSIILDEISVFIRKNCTWKSLTL